MARQDPTRTPAPPAQEASSPADTLARIRAALPTLAPSE